MKIIAYGHKNVRGTHKTTFEITKDKDLTERGTCIIGVNASYDLDELKVFKTKAVTIFAVVQFFMATALAFSSFFSWQLLKLC